MTHRFLFAAAAVAALATAAPAMAQDDWTGLYVGVNAGLSWGDTSLDIDAGTAAGTITVPPADLALINQTSADDDNKTSFTAGLQAGYNYQVGWLILGIETDVGFFDLDQQRTNTYQSAVNTGVNYGLDQRVKTEWIWTVRPRIGIAGGPWMVYATGGIATSKIKLETTFADNRIPRNVATVNTSDTDTGWTGGLGGAFLLTENISVRGEWLYVDFGKVHETVTGPNGFVAITPEAKVRANLFRLGVDYKF